MPVLLDYHGISLVCIVAEPNKRLVNKYLG